MGYKNKQLKGELLEVGQDFNELALEPYHQSQNTLTQALVNFN